MGTEYETESGDESNDESLEGKSEIQVTFPPGLSLQNKQLEQIMNQMKRDEDKYERRRWGGQSQATWKRCDVNLILKLYD